MTAAPSKIVLLLTGTVDVGAMAFTRLTDVNQRKQDYLKAIRYYLNRFPYPVVFVENSGNDLAPELMAELASGRLEVLTYSGNQYNPELGKGYGEARSILHGIHHARSITEDCFVFKITGRYSITNAQCFFREYETHPELDLLADLTNNFRWSMSFIVGFRPSFVKKYLAPNSEQINDTAGFAFEHALAKSVLEAIGDQVQFRIFRYYPKLEAISGTTGKPYRNAWWYMWPRQIKYWIRFLIVIR